ncbi:hypothetical protein GQ457_01G026780 [Hibiscus cannabinus]
MSGKQYVTVAIESLVISWIRSRRRRRKLLSKLEANEGRIAITTDVWTADHQNRGYMAVTAHYIDDEWTLQKRIIRFEYVPTPHTSDFTAACLMKMFSGLEYR